MTEQNLDKKELILSDDFENALISAAEIKNEKLSLCKDRNKNNYSCFYDIMLASRNDIQEILNRKKKNRTDDDNNKVKEFKKNISQSYKQVCDLLVDDSEEDEETKIQKIVHKISNVVKILQYIGNTDIEKEFEKCGIELKYEKMSDNDVFKQEHIKNEIERVFNVGKQIKEEINDNNEEIKTTIYENNVPTDLQYDKSMNPTGIKNTDFCKLVDLKAKFMKAKDDEEKEKISEQANNIAGDYMFQNKRNEIINQKLIEIGN